MDKKEIVRRLMATFLAELDDSRQLLNSQLVSFETSAEGSAEQSELRQALMRTAHNLKGAARSVGLSLIEQSCHSFEELISRSHKEAKPLTADGFKLLFATVDGLEEASFKLHREEKVEGGILEDALAGLKALLSGAGKPAAAGATSKVEPKPSETAPAEQPEPMSTVAERTAVSEARPLEGSSVRVYADKLDQLLNRSGELLVKQRRLLVWAEKMRSLYDDVARLKVQWRGSKAQGVVAEAASPDTPVSLGTHTAGKIEDIEKRLGQALVAIDADRRELDQAAQALDDQVRQLRMLPFLQVCQGLERTVRDLAKAEGKDVELKVAGGDVEIDRSVLQGLKDPLLHLVRNAVDHGIEVPAQRVRQQKPARGSVTVAAAVNGARVQVTVADDGGGLDVEAIKKQAKKMKIALPTDDSELGQVLFMPGFSTARTITEVSGRGVGLDVVKTQLQALHGTVDVAFVPGGGTRFNLTVPLTLTMVRVLLVSAGGHTFAISSSGITRLMRVAPKDFHEVSGRTVLRTGDEQVTCVALAEVLGLERPEPKATGKIAVVVLSADERQAAFVVDELLAEQEVMVKNLGSRVKRLRNVSGATILPSGQVALMLNIPDLLQSAARQRLSAALGEVKAQQDKAKKQHHLLVIDDSVTTRSLEKSILEAAGYKVSVAIDGQMGLAQLEAHGADMVITDAQMPRMDGFEFIAAVRRSERFQNLPVILVTSLNDEESKAKGMQAGASAYVVKGTFEQTRFLRLVEQLL